MKPTKKMAGKEYELTKTKFRGQEERAVVFLELESK